jgi:hypothetical protein
MRLTSQSFGASMTSGSGPRRRTPTLNCLPSVGADKRDELSKRFDNAKHELWAHVHVGQLSVSRQCSESLEALLSSIAAEEHRFDEDWRGDEEYSEHLAEHCEKVRDLIDSGLPAILAAAQKDLD